MRFRSVCSSSWLFVFLAAVNSSYLSVVSYLFMRDFNVTMSCCSWVCLGPYLAFLVGGSEFGALYWKLSLRYWQLVPAGILGGRPR